MRAVITGFSPDQSSASAASQREAAIARKVSTGCLLRITKESGAGIPGTSWAVTSASPGPPAHMGGAITQSVPEFTQRAPEASAFFEYSAVIQFASPM